MWTFFIESVFSLSLFIGAGLLIPQMIRLYQKKDSRELSLITFTGFTVLQFFTLLYGNLHNDYLLIIGAAVGFVTCAAITGMIIYYRLVG